MKKNNPRDTLNGTLLSLEQLFYSKVKYEQNIDNKTNINSCWNALDHSQNNFEGLTQWEFVPLGLILTYTTSNLNNLRNYLEANPCIEDNRWNHKNRHSNHDLPQTCGGRIYICQVWIRPTENSLKHPRTSFSINEHWYNKYDTYKSTINKIRLERITWRIFYTKQSNQIKQKILNNHPAPSSWTSTALWWKQIRMFGLDMAHKQFSNTPKDKFQYQWMIIISTQTNRSTINDTNMITKKLQEKLLYDK